MLAVVIPTLNEKDSIGGLINRLIELHLAAILIVDDGSTDGTAEIVGSLSKEHSEVHLLKRSGEKGLGRAYADGFRHLLQYAPPEIDTIVQMDADNSHDPAVIPEMLEKIKEGYDLILGSRYIQGGKIEKWNWFRRIVSRFGNYYARLILWLPIKDLTGGFKCWRRSLLEKIVSRPLNSLGYVFQIETTYRAHKLGAKITEIPITFTERKLGGSKFSLKIILEAYLSVIKLKFKKTNE